MGRSKHVCVLSSFVDCPDIKADFREVPYKIIHLQQDSILTELTDSNGGG